MDADNGRAGILEDPWTDPTQQFKGIYRIGQFGCMPFLSALAKPNGRLGDGITGSPDFNRQFDPYQRYKESGERTQPAWAGRYAQYDVELRHRTATGPGPGQRRAVTFRIVSRGARVHPPVAEV